VQDTSLSTDQAARTIFSVRGSWGIALVAASLLVSACGGSASGDRPGSQGSAPAAPLDCGAGEAGSKHAVREFFSVLRSGDEQGVLDALATGGRFEWLTIYDKRRKTIVDVHGNRRAAAAAVAEYGGLPVRATNFMNIDRPSATTDFGFEGTWAGRAVVGKGALDCRQGRARVLTIELSFKVAG